MGLLEGDEFPGNDDVVGGAHGMVVGAEIIAEELEEILRLGRRPAMPVGEIAECRLAGGRMVMEGEVGEGESLLCLFFIRSFFLSSRVEAISHYGELVGERERETYGFQGRHLLANC